MFTLICHVLVPTFRVVQAREGIDMNFSSRKLPVPVIPTSHECTESGNGIHVCLTCVFSLNFSPSQQRDSWKNHAKWGETCFKTDKTFLSLKHHVKRGPFTCIQGFNQKQKFKFLGSRQEGGAKEHQIWDLKWSLGSEGKGLLWGRWAEVEKCVGIWWMREEGQWWQGNAWEWKKTEGKDGENNEPEHKVEIVTYLEVLSVAVLELSIIWHDLDQQMDLHWTSMLGVTITRLRCYTQCIDIFTVLSIKNSLSILDITCQTYKQTLAYL